MPVSPEEQLRLSEYYGIWKELPQLQDIYLHMRRTHENEISIESQLYLFTIAPALLGFVNWVLDEAMAAEKKKLYFLSRDGYQMQLIAKSIAEKRGIPIECRYLYVSRYAMRLPSYCLDMGKYLDSICVGGIDVTCDKILRRGGLTNVEVDEVVRELHLENRRSEILNYHQVQELKRTLRTSKWLEICVRNHSKAAYENAIGYLTQEGLMCDDAYALVDSGWIGTLQMSIEKLVQSVKPDVKVEGYYFGMYECPRGESKKFHTYYFGRRSGAYYKSIFSNSLFETIVSDGIGMTLGYQKTDRGFEPILHEKENPNAALLTENTKALAAFVLGAESDIAIPKKLIAKSLRLFMSRPTELELRLYGDTKFSDDVLDGCYKKVAAELTMEQIKEQRLLYKLLHIVGVRKTPIYESAWLEGSAARLGENCRSNFRHIQWYKYLLYVRKQMKR